MITNDAFTAIAQIDLEQIKMKLMHPTFGEGWSKARADAMALEYRRFLYLQFANPGEISSPTEDVDTFWHYHILDTMKYAEDCDKAFGYFMHHYPYVGLLEDDEKGIETQAADRTRVLYEATFGEAYIRAEAYGEEAAAAFACDAEHQSSTQAAAALSTACASARPLVGQASCAGCQMWETARPAVVVGKTTPCNAACAAAKSAAVKPRSARCTPCGTFRPGMTLGVSKPSASRTTMQLV